MYVEVNELDLKFNFEKKGTYNTTCHLLTIWTDGGYIEVNMNDKELEDLRSVLK